MVSWSLSLLIIYSHKHQSFFPSNEFISFTLLDICTCHTQIIIIYTIHSSTLHTILVCLREIDVGVIALKRNLPVFSVQFLSHFSFSSLALCMTFHFFEAKHTKKCWAQKFFSIPSIAKKSYIIILFLAFRLRCANAAIQCRADTKKEVHMHSIVCF